MNTEQIYELVNDVAEQALGETAIAAVDTQGLISLGNNVLSSQTYTEGFLNTLAMRIGKTIMSERMYRNKLGDMVLNDFEYGAILQKISMHLVDAQEDPSADLVNGGSVDPWKIYKPDVEQKLFVTRTPYMFPITIQRRWLKEAFLSESAMGSFLSMVFSRIRDSIEFSLENLGRICLANFAAETTNVIPLVTNYNAETGKTLTADTAKHDKDFMAYAVAQFNHYSDMLTDMSTQWNDGSIERHTPKEDQRFKIISDFNRRLETVVQYAAFHDSFVTPEGDGYYNPLNFWQNEQSPYQVKIDRASDGTSITINNVVAMIYDRDALGMYKKTEEVLTSPVNVYGMYYNQAYHEQQLWFNDLSENFVLFTLN